MLPLPEMVPTVALPLTMPSTVQVTAVLVVPVTEALIDVEAVGFRLMVVGVMATRIGAGASTLMELATDWRGSATLVATTVWVPEVEGAV